MLALLLAKSCLPCLQSDRSRYCRLCEGGGDVVGFALRSIDSLVESV